MNHGQTRPPMPNASLSPRLPGLLLALLTSSGAALAQNIPGVQRIVGPDGRVTYTDQVRTLKHS